MRIFKYLTFLIVVLLPAALSAQDEPRIDGKNDALGAKILLNELNTSAYPEMQIFATVLQDGVPVTGLTADDFRVREDEVDQLPLTVEPKLPPLSVVLAVDVSGSMARRITETRKAAKAFLSTLGSADSVQLLSFARRIETPTAMTQDIDSVMAAIDGLNARGDTALYDAVMRSVELVAKSDGRKAIVLLSDGVDDDGTGQQLSQSSVDDVLIEASKVNVPVFVIGLGTDMDETVLKRIADRTGAIYLNAPDVDQLETVYRQIGDQLSGQYAIRYTSNLPADGTERRVDLAALGAQTNKIYTANGTLAEGTDDKTEELAASDTAESHPIVRLILVDGQSEQQIEGDIEWLFINTDTEDVITLNQPSDSTTQEIPTGKYDVVAQINDTTAEQHLTIVDQSPSEMVVKIVAAAAPGLRLSADTAPAGSIIQATWTVESQDTDLIFIRAADSAKNWYPVSDYERHVVKDGPVANLVLPAKPGQYEVRYFSKSAGLLYSTPLEVTESDVEIDAPRTIQRGSSFQVRVKGPDAPDDIVIIIKPSEADNRYPLSSDRNKSFAEDGTPDKDGFRTFEMVAPNKSGSYELRYYSRANVAVLKRRVIVVR